MPAVANEAVEVSRAQLPSLHVRVQVDTRNRLLERPSDDVEAQQPLHLVEGRIDPHRVQECRVQLHQHRWELRRTPEHQLEVR